MALLRSSRRNYPHPRRRRRRPRSRRRRRRHQTGDQGETPGTCAYGVHVSHLRGRRQIPVKLPPSRAAPLQTEEVGVWDVRQGIPG